MAESRYKCRSRQRSGNREGGIHHRDVGAAREHEPPGGFILGGSVKPQAIENNVVDGAARLVDDQIVDRTFGSGRVISRPRRR